MSKETSTLVLYGLLAIVIIALVILFIYLIIRAKNKVYKTIARRYVQTLEQSLETISEKTTRLSEIDTYLKYYAPTPISQRFSTDLADLLNEKARYIDFVERVKPAVQKRNSSREFQNISHDAVYHYELSRGLDRKCATLLSRGDHAVQEIVNAKKAYDNFKKHFETYQAEIKAIADKGFTLVVAYQTLLQAESSLASIAADLQNKKYDSVIVKASQGESQLQLALKVAVEQTKLRTKARRAYTEFNKKIDEIEGVIVPAERIRYEKLLKEFHPSVTAGLATTFDDAMSRISAVRKSLQTVEPKLNMEIQDWEGALLNIEQLKGEMDRIVRYIMRVKEYEESLRTNIQGLPERLKKADSMCEDAWDIVLAYIYKIPAQVIQNLQLIEGNLHQIEFMIAESQPRYLAIQQAMQHYQSDITQLSNQAKEYINNSQVNQGEVKKKKRKLAIR